LLGSAVLQLRVVRLKRGMTLREFDELVGLSFSDLCALELGYRIYPNWKRKIAEALGKTGRDADRLFTEADEEEVRRYQRKRRARVPA
jgi:transcriptional regulator with XRE-family HTH domain